MLSGGIAYVYDPDGRLPLQANLAGIALERVEPAASHGDGQPREAAAGVQDNGMGHLLRHDAERLRILLERHRLATGSARAAELLADWPGALRHFVKVVPTEYRRALHELDREAEVAAAAAA